MAAQMKLEEMRHRETQEQHFGKRGMSYHGAVVYFAALLAGPWFSATEVGVPGTATMQPFQLLFFDDLVSNSQQQDSVAALSLMEATFARIRHLLPGAATVSVQADNAAAYASPFMLFMLPLVARQHGLLLTEFIHNEAGDGKTLLDGHFGIQTRMLREYVDAGRDVTTPAQAVAALRSNPLRNTVVSLVEFDLSRLTELEQVLAVSPVSGSKQIRHAIFDAEGGIRVFQVSGVTPPATIPAAYVAKVLAALPTAGRAGTAFVTGVSWAGDEHPPVSSRSRVWGAREEGDAAAAPALVPPELPFSLLRSGCGSVEVLRCNSCERLFVHVHGYAAHVCRPSVSNTVLERGSALALRLAPYRAPAPVARVPEVDAPADALTKFAAGWALYAPPEVEKLDETTTLHLTRWFDEGQRSGKTKCSAAQAVMRLSELADAAGQRLYTADELPSEKRVKRFFSALAQKARAQARKADE